VVDFPPIEVSGQIRPPQGSTCKKAGYKTAALSDGTQKNTWQTGGIHLKLFCMVGGAMDNGTILSQVRRAGETVGDQ
jgi:hypothetical protein